VRAAFKDSLPEVSNTRLDQTLYAEHPDLKAWVEYLCGEKTLHAQEDNSRRYGKSRLRKRAGEQVGLRTSDFLRFAARRTRQVIGFRFCIEMH
jgi:hypothetical protein